MSRHFQVAFIVGKINKDSILLHFSKIVEMRNHGKKTMLRWKSHILKWIVGTAWISKIGPFQCRTQARGQANPVPWGGDGWSDITFFCQQPACLYS